MFLLQNLERTYNEQVARGSPSAVAVYSYAHGLIKSNNRNVRKGIKLLEGYWIIGVVSVVVVSLLFFFLKKLTDLNIKGD